MKSLIMATFLVSFAAQATSWDCKDLKITVEGKAYTHKICVNDDHSKIISDNCLDTACLAQSQHKVELDWKKIAAAESSDKKGMEICSQLRGTTIEINKIPTCYFAGDKSLIDNKSLMDRLYQVR